MKVNFIYKRREGFGFKAMFQHTKATVKGKRAQSTSTALWTMNLNRKERTFIGFQEDALPNKVWWAREFHLMRFPPSGSNAT
jgi:hypothetical protein